MKKSSLLRSTLGFLVLAAAVSTSTAQPIFNDNMESYPTATTTSVNDFANQATSNPAFWARNSFQGGGPTVNVTAGITGAPGSRAALLSADFSGATGFWGAQLFSNAVAGSGSAASYADLSYSYTVQSSSGFGFYLQFTSFDSSFNPTGSYRKSLFPTTAGVYQTFSGNLGEVGWAANPNGLSPNNLVLNAANYSWSVEYGGDLGWTASAGNSLLVDQASFAVIPEPSSAILIGLSVFALALHSRLRRV
jgi:hypothetical protein